MPSAQVTDTRDPSSLRYGRRDTSIRANWRTLAVAFYLGISLFGYGFDKGAIAGFQAMPGFLMIFGYQSPGGEWDIHVSVVSTRKVIIYLLTSQQAGPQQIISSFMILGSFLGSLLSGPLGTNLCRRYSIMLGSLLMIISVIIMVLTTSLGVLYFSRLLIGVANGLLLNFTLVYLQECSSAHFRGLCFGISTLWITTGTTVGMVSSIPPLFLEQG